MIKNLLLCILLVTSLYYFYKYKSLKLNINGLVELLKNKIKTDNYSKMPDNTNNKIFNELVDNIDDLIIENKNLEIQKDRVSREYRDLLADLSHDLRTPLTSILGYIPLINTDDEKSKGYLNTINGKAEYLNNLIENFYEFSLISSTTYEVEKLEYIDLNELVYAIGFEYYDSFVKNNQDFKINAPESKLEILSSKELLSKAMHNILGNLLKYSEGNNEINIVEEDKKINIIVSNDTSLEDGDYNFLFERSRVIDKSRKNSTGIGLAIVKVAFDKLKYESNIYCKNSRFIIEIEIKK